MDMTLLPRPGSSIAIHILESLLFGPALWQVGGTHEFLGLTIHSRLNLLSVWQPKKVLPHLPTYTLYIQGLSRSIPSLSCPCSTPFTLTQPGVTEPIIKLLGLYAPCHMPLCWLILWMILYFESMFLFDKSIIIILKENKYPLVVGEGRVMVECPPSSFNPSTGVYNLVGHWSSPNYNNKVQTLTVIVVNYCFFFHFNFSIYLIPLTWSSSSVAWDVLWFPSYLFDHSLKTISSVTIPASEVPQKIIIELLLFFINHASSWSSYLKMYIYSIVSTSFNFSGAFHCPYPGSTFRLPAIYNFTNEKDWNI